MTDSIRHRGPDDSGAFTDDGCGLAMRRLAILDIPGGRQPLASSDGRYVIVFNGEIYNFGYLRRDLEVDGWSFTTNSDTEVLLAAFARHGTDCLHRLNGMFAMAVWDRRDRVLTLARDRLGVKPLYYAWDGKRFLFASEIKALMVSGLVAAKINPRAVWDYLTLRYVPQPETIWTGIRKLPPGHHLTIRLEDGTGPQERRWWNIPFSAEVRRGRDATFLDEFSNLFDDSVRLRLISDVPVGILLSGGLDSSAVAAAAKTAGAGAVNSYSVAFDDPLAVNELPYARQVASHLGLIHHEVIIGQKEFIDFLPDFVRFTDEPLADLASVPLYHVCKLARSGVKVVLSGEGADEILAGYTFDQVAAQWEPSRPHVGWLTRLFHGDEGGYAHADQRGHWPPPVMTNSMDGPAKAAFLRGFPEMPNSLARTASDIQGCASPDGLNQILYSYCQSWLVEDLLMKADKMSMAASLELRTPFLDFRLVEWAATLPTRWKVGREGGAFVTKRILRHYANQRLPAAIIERPKQGFPVPVYQWLSEGLRDFASDMLAPGCRLEALAHRQAIGAQVAAGTGPDATMADRHRLWQSLILELWLRAWEPDL
jgi:asparagine synthase (glutamine-hydrolysing)